MIQSESLKIEQAGLPTVEITRSEAMIIVRFGLMPYGDELAMLNWFDCIVEFLLTKDGLKSNLLDSGYAIFDQSRQSNNPYLLCNTIPWARDYEDAKGSILLLLRTESPFLIR